MTEEQRQRLRAIKTFGDLTAYLRTELDWPIEEGYDEDDLTFDWSDDLGLKDSERVGIREIKQLRPLETGQPWGIFFVNFEKKQLPIVILRRILNALVMRKRANASKAQQAAWQQHDLLFISAYGEDSDRQLTFAHFSEPGSELDTSKATLRVLGWDDDDTNLKLDYVADKLHEKLIWPQDTSNLEQWRQQWAEAFELRPRQVISTAKELALSLAELAKRIRNRMLLVLPRESESGELRKLLKGFKTALIHDLDEKTFADMYAQTITYGLFSARVSRHEPGEPGAVVHDDIVDMVPVTNPFLKEMLQSFLKAGGRKGKLDFDELGIHEVVDLLNDKKTNLEAVLRDFGNKRRDEDPVIHFYEDFLKAYDKKLKVQRGVFYTPQPVVSYIVRSVHELLQTEFGLEDGLADTTTWGEMLKKHPGLQLPMLQDDVGRDYPLDENEPFVQILDPATGTATFLVEVIDVIHRTMTAKWKKQGMSEAERTSAWNDYVPKHLLPRLHAFELMMAPYAIAHMKIGLKLQETGYRFRSEERARIYLTNALEPWVRQLPFIEFAALAHEAAAVNEIKRHKRFTVVIGNPPYSVTSANFNPFIDGLMDDYKKHVRGEQGLVALADDYLKFVRLSQKLLAAPDCGFWGMITNHGYLKGLIHRGVRKELLGQFSAMFILDLHGDSNIGERAPAGRSNENVFDIQQGVAVSIAVRPFRKPSMSAVRHCDLWGSRNEKYADLSSHPVSIRKWTDLRPVAPQCFLIPFDDANLAEYEVYPSLNDLMAVNSCGVKTHRDGVVIDCDKKTLVARMSDIASERRLELLRERYSITDTPNWKLKEAQLKIKTDEVPQFIQRLTYRPFDYRWIYYNPKIIEKGDSKYPTLRHMLHSNVALLSARIQATGVFDAVFVSKFLVEMKTAESSRSCTVFPLFLMDDAGSLRAELSNGGLRPNLNTKILFSWAQKLGVKPKGNFGLPAGLTPEDIFHYIYAVFHSPAYRSRYAEFLKIDFPRLPLTGSLELFRALAQLGGEQVALHLLESPRLDHPITEFIGSNKQVAKVGYAEGTVWIDASGTKKEASPGTSGFRGVPEAVWNFHIGGYQVCEKWLKDRKGRTLSGDDIAHYHKIVVALAETIRLMAEIDRVIDQHGGWPGAFQTTEVAA
ncbi:type ISP restriction/modification enzyme [Algiphilus sp. W345]|uniref:site-specific DNA-methyltransferase (adenine-specific) n=1 Tax=Banduia mediterranea TaxID=3075609 RepID=A0ABU2WN07_9GAMM|nr:type ISP restriction/modification enzyme [Algiphilus sp. W345]MDT0498925.1 type ISP restriction/modification enzyme [Algiphilus sp. W345]